MYAIVNQQPEPIPDAPERLQRILEKALEKDPAKRYANAAEMAADWEALASGEQASPGLSNKPARRGEWTSKRRLFGLPLVHVASGFDPATGSMGVARGVIAVANFAFGAVAVGGISFGGIAAGRIDIGITSIGGIAVALARLGGALRGNAALRRRGHRSGGDSSNRASHVGRTTKRGALCRRERLFSPSIVQGTMDRRGQPHDQLLQDRLQAGRRRHGATSTVPRTRSSSVTNTIGSRIERMTTRPPVGSSGRSSIVCRWNPSDWRRPCPATRFSATLRSTTQEVSDEKPTRF